MCLLGFFSAASMRRGFMARAANGMVIQDLPCAVSAGTATLMEHLAFGGKVQGWAPEPLARPSSALSPRVSAFSAARGRESHFGYPSWGALWPHGQLLEAVHPAVGAGRWASPAECADESVKPRRSVEEDTRVKSAAYGHPTHLYFGGAVHQWRLPKTATSAIRGFVFCDLCELWLCLHDGRTDGRTDVRTDGCDWRTKSNTNFTDTLTSFIGQASVRLTHSTDGYICGYGYGSHPKNVPVNSSDYIRVLEQPQPAQRWQ